VNVEAPHRHEILFCSDDEVLLRGLTRFMGAALKVGHSAIVLATEPHREILLQRLRKEVNVDTAIRQGTYVSLDAAENPDPFDFPRSSEVPLRRPAKSLRQNIRVLLFAVNERVAYGRKANWMTRFGSNNSAMS
jgi:hypothetical protein